ncbi:MAG: pyrroloquinoline quinone biosynthesis protein PqqE [Chthoniobacteraceae bacterium]
MQTNPGTELTTAEWARVFQEAAALGVLHVGLSGGEPLLRRDLPEFIAAARQAGLYTNLITSALGLDARKPPSCAPPGSIPSRSAFRPTTKSWATKSPAPTPIRASWKPPPRARSRFPAQPQRRAAPPQHRPPARPPRPRRASRRATPRACQHPVLRLGLENRTQLLLTREQVQGAFAIAQAAQLRLRGQMEVLYVLPDYFETRPKPCMQGWGQRYLTVNPMATSSPAPTPPASPACASRTSAEQFLAAIWRASESFDRFRGEEWMPLPCRECPERAHDFGGCRCQAALLTGDATATDPVCRLSPHHATLQDLVQSAEAASDPQPWHHRQNPTKSAAANIESML